MWQRPFSSTTNVERITPVFGFVSRVLPSLTHRQFTP
jgi:hypothetical protein